MSSRLVEYFEKSGVTRAEFSKASGISEPLLCQYLAGKRRPGLDHAFAIERATGGEVTAEYLQSLPRVGRDQKKAV
jgi:DNA-binding transcriptional regulator YdaS (Cro superfamily)